MVLLITIDVWIWQLIHHLELFCALIVNVFLVLEFNRLNQNLFGPSSFLRKGLFFGSWTLRRFSCFPFAILFSSLIGFYHRLFDSLWLWLNQWLVDWGSLRFYLLGKLLPCASFRRGCVLKLHYLRLWLENGRCIKCFTSSILSRSAMVTCKFRILDRWGHRICPCIRVDRYNLIVSLKLNGVELKWKHIFGRLLGIFVFYIYIDDVRVLNIELVGRFHRILL